MEDFIQEEISTLYQIMRAVWAADTSLDPKHWTPSNPSLGHCEVASLIVQDLFGGDLIRAEFPGGSHYWNRLSDGREVDMTADQFWSEWDGKRAPMSNTEVRTRDYVLSSPETRERYERLRKRVLELLP